MKNATQRRPQQTDMDASNRPSSMRSDSDMNRGRRNAEMGTGIRNEDDIDLGIDAELDDDMSDETRA